MRFNHRMFGPVLVPLLLQAVNSGASAAEPYFEQVIYPGSGVTVTSATGSNARGDIVGQYIAMGVAHGYLLDRHGNFTAIDFPGAIATNAFSINSPGDISGDFRLVPNGAILGFVRRAGEWTTIDCSMTLGAVHTFALGINSAGLVVGEYEVTPAPNLGAPGRAFLYQDGGCIDITPPDAQPGTSAAVAWTVNDSGDAAGYYATPGGSHGWVRDRDGNFTTIDFPGSAFTNVRGINAAGDMVGVYRDVANGPNRGFLRSADGAFSTLGYPGATVNRALGINARGDVVGDYSGADCPINRCVWIWHRGNSSP